MRFHGFVCGVLLLVASPAKVRAVEPVVVDFEQVTVLFPGERPNRVEKFEDKGVIFELAHAPKKSKGKGLVMFFEHSPDKHKGIASAMALEPIPVRATFPAPVSAVTVTFWGSTGTPVALEAFDRQGRVVSRMSLESAPGRKSPGDPIPLFPLTVQGEQISYIEFSGPREGEYLAADEVRFAPVGEDPARRHE